MTVVDLVGTSVGNFYIDTLRKTYEGSACVGVSGGLMYGQRTFCYFDFTEDDITIDPTLSTNSGKGTAGLKAFEDEYMNELGSEVAPDLYALHLHKSIKPLVMAMYGEIDKLGVANLDFAEIYNDYISILEDYKQTKAQIEEEKDTTRLEFLKRELHREECAVVEALSDFEDAIIFMFVRYLHMLSELRDTYMKLSSMYEADKYLFIAPVLTPFMQGEKHYVWEDNNVVGMSLNTHNLNELQDKVTKAIKFSESYRGYKTMGFFCDRGSYDFNISFETAKQLIT